MEEAVQAVRLSAAFLAISPHRRGLTFVRRHRHTVPHSPGRNLAAPVPFQQLSNGCFDAGARRPGHWLVQPLRPAPLLRAAGRQLGGHADESHENACIWLD